MPCETQRAELRHLINNITNRRTMGEGGGGGRRGGGSGGGGEGDIKRNNGMFFLAIGEPGMIEGGWGRGPGCISGVSRGGRACRGGGGGAGRGKEERQKIDFAKSRHRS